MKVEVAMNDKLNLIIILMKQKMPFKRNHFLKLLLCAALFLPQHVCAQFDWPYHIKEGIVKTKVPERAAGQQHVLNLKCEKLPVVRVAFIGLGMRGQLSVERWLHQEGVQIVALCDHEQSRADQANERLRKAGFPPAAVYSGAEGYKEACKRNDVDLVFIATDWDHHFPTAQFAMNNGKHVAIEVPSAMNMREIWALINLSETTRKHCMMLENCCYDFFEMNTLSMAQKGLFGEIVYAMGAYRHDLTPYWDEYWKGGAPKLGWRLDYNMKYRGDVYPTHGLGPVAQLLNLHRGDRMKTLIAMDTKSFNGRKLASKGLGQDVKDFRNGDQTATLIRTEKGKVLEIHHNTMNPQPYNRMYQITGTEGFANKYPIEGYCLTKPAMQRAGVNRTGNYEEGEDYMSKTDMATLVNKYRNPLITKYEKRAKEVGGHGGMDYIMDSRLIYCLQHGLPLDIDVYDLAEWCCLAELGSIAMDNGNLPVEVPDFTRGHWNEVQGFGYAFASPEEEKAHDEANHAFTMKLKTTAEKLWKKYDKAHAKR